MVQSIKNLIAVILIAVSGFIFMTEILPTYNLISQLKVVIQERLELLNARMEIFQGIEGLDASVKNKYTELQRLALIIPEKKAIPELLSSIEAIFAKSGGVLTSLETGDNPTEDKDAINKISIEINGQGAYFNLTGLLNYLEKNIRIFDVTSLDVTAESSTLEQQNPILNFKIVGNIYWIESQISDQDKSVTPRREGNEL